MVAGWHAQSTQGREAGKQAEPPGWLVLRVTWQGSEPVDPTDTK